LIAAKAKENQIQAGKQYGENHPQELLQNSAEPLVPIDTRSELAKAAGVSHDTIMKVEKIKQDATPEIKEKVKSGELSINQAYKKTTAKEKKEKRMATIKEKALETTTKYPIVYADPPWKYDYAEAGNREVENQYPTMDVDSICNLPVQEITTNDAVLYLWATAPKIREALRVIAAWGFEYKTHAIWDKEKIGMGYWFRGQHELLMVGTKGSFPPPDADKRVSSVIRDARTDHSKKPDIVYTIIESAYPELPKIELFSRKAREKWDSWGNQV
jgi:N6-adenosine-specific RNA methylase IME4